MNKQNSKYLLLGDDYKEINSIRYYRIQYMSEFTAIDGTQIYPGTLGGYIHNDQCLTHAGVAVVLGERTILSADSYISNPDSLVDIDTYLDNTVVKCVLESSIGDKRMKIKANTMVSMSLNVVDANCTIDLNGEYSGNELINVDIIGTDDLSIVGNDINLKNVQFLAGGPSVNSYTTLESTNVEHKLTIDKYVHIKGCTVIINPTTNIVSITDSVRINGYRENRVSFSGDYISLSGDATFCSGHYENALLSTGSYGCE